MPAVPAPAELRPALPRCLWGAWRTVQHDPIGVLFPASGLLLLQVLGALLARAVWDGVGPREAVATFFVAAAVQSVIGAPLRSRMIAAGARAHGLRVRPWGRPAALLGVQLVTGPAHLGAGLAVALPLLGVAAGFASEGWLSTSSVVAAAGVCGGTLASLAVRGLLAWAPIEAVVGGASGLGALWRSVVRGGRERPVAFSVVLLGDLLVAFGGLICGAGALPGYPIADLALLHRWSGARRGADA